MDRLIPIIVVIAAVASWWWFEQVLTGGRARSPLWMAFSMTAVSAVYLVSGLIGYTLDRHDRFVARTAWAGGVIWSEVAVGYCDCASGRLLLAQGSARHPRGQIASRPTDGPAYNASRISRTSTTRTIPAGGGSSTPRTSAATICSIVTRPRRCALARVAGNSRRAPYRGLSTIGQR